MKSYVMKDKELAHKNPIGYLFYYEKFREFIIELREDLDEWEAPLLFQKFVRERKFTIPNYAAFMWVQERIIPSGRQNIGAILKQAKLNEYNEMSLLALSKGKCSQDNCYLEEIEYGDIPEKIRERTLQNVLECFVSGSQNIVCLFRDNFVCKISLKKMQPDFPDLSHVLKQEALLRTIRVGAGGYSISFNNSIEIPVSALRDKQYEAVFTAEDFKYFVQNNVVDTTKACELLQCSRQNIAYLIKTGKLEPIMTGTKENFFTLGSIMRTE